MQNMTMDMDMTLHFGEREKILFSWWKTGSLIGMAGSMLIIFLLAILYEAIRGVRVWIAVSDSRTARLLQQSASPSPSGEASPNDSISLRRSLFASSAVSSWKMRVLHAVLHAVSSLLGFSLMLIVMTFNVNLIMAVTAGMTVGFFLFSGTPHVDSRDLHDCC